MQRERVRQNNELYRGEVDSRLVGWRAPAHTPSRTGRSILAVVFLLILAMFTYVLWAPFRRSDVHFLVIGPDSVMESPSSIEEFDYSNIFAIRNASLVSKAIQSSLSPALVHSEWRRPIGSFNAEASGMVHSHIHTESTLVVYLSGLLAMDRSEPVISDSSRDASQSGNGLRIISLINTLRSIRCKQILLCIDATTPVTKGPVNMAASLMQEMACEQIERSLQDSDRTPIAVELRLSYIEHVIQHGSSMSPLAKSICSALEVGGCLNGGAKGTVTLEGLQRSLTCDTAETNTDAIANGNSPSKNWLVSANWPLDTVWIVLPKSGIAKDIATGSSDSSEKATPENSSNVATVALAKDGSAKSDAGVAGIAIATVKSDAMESIFSDGSVDQLLATCENILAGWAKSPSGLTQDRLHLPAPMSRLYECSYAFVRIKKRFQELSFLNRVSPSLIDRSEIVGLTRYLVSLEKNEPISGIAPVWIQDIAKAIHAMQLEPSSSLVVNATYASLHLLPVEDRATWTETLVIWTSKLYAESDADELVAWIEQLPPSLRSFDEWKWARWVLEQPELSRNMRRDLIFNRLLGTRLACDPLTEHWCAPVLQDGDSHQIKAERLVADRTSSNWMLRAQEELMFARDSYQHGIDNLSRVRELRRDYSTHLAAMLLEQPWNHPANCQVDSMHPIDRIRDMEACLKDLVSQVAGGKTSRSPQTAMLISATRDLNGMSRSHGHPHYFGKTNQKHCQLASEQFIATWRMALMPVYPEAARRVQDAGNTLLQQLEEVSLSNEAQVIAFAEFERKIHFLAEEMDEWMNAHAHSLPKQSPFWTFASEMLKTNPRTIAKFVVDSPSALLPTAQANLLRARRFLDGATLEECRQVEAEYRWWQGVAKNNAESEESGLPRISILAPDCIPFVSESSMTTPIELHCDRAIDLPILVQMVYDENAIQVSINDVTVPSGDSVDVMQLCKGHENTIRFPLTTRKLSGLTESKRIGLMVRHGPHCSRCVLAVDGPKAPFVSLRVRNVDVAGAESVVNNDILFSNRVSPITLEATNLSRESSVLIGRVHLSNAILENVPSGALTIQEASSWLASVRSISSSISSKPCRVAGAESQELVFEPAPAASGNEMESTSEMLIEIRDESKDRVQFYRYLPRVVKPGQVVSTQVSYDANRRVLDIAGALQSSIVCGTGHMVQCRLLEHLDQPSIAKGGFLLSLERPHNRMALTTSGCRTEKALLSIDIDGWEAAMLYEIDLSRSGAIQPSVQFAAMQLRDPTGRGFAATDKERVEVVLDVWMHDGVMESNGDKIQVGLDKNGNRQLDDDAHLELSKTKSIRFEYKGVGPTGRLEIKACVESHRIKLPIEMEWDRRVSAIALINRGSRVIQSNSVPIAFDRLSPSINATRVASPQPLMIGPPVLVEVTASDAGLSGISAVEGCWSTNGELEWSEATKGIPALFRDGERWLFTMPTPTLPSGRSVLLIRAIDRAGNPSKTYPLTLEFFDAESLAARHASITTTVHGVALYGKQTVPGMTVQLSKADDGELGKTPSEASPQANPAKKKLVKTISTTQTGNDGRFSMIGIPSGTYELEVSGIVKGLRTKTSVQVDVAAPVPPSPIQIRLDQRP